MSVAFSSRKKALFSLLTIALILIALNLIAKGYERWQQRSQTTQAAVAVEHPYWQVQPGQKLPVTLIRNYDDGKIKINSKGYRGPEFEAKKPYGRFRIVCIGDSCTFGRKHSYPEMLSALLNNGGEKDLYEVINGGIEGAKSAWALERMRDALQYEPDLIVVYIGWNDLYTMAPGADSGTESGRLEQLLMRAPLFRVLRRWIFVEAKRATMEREATVEAARLSRYQPKLYEQNLHAMATLAREHGVKIVFLTLASVVGANLSEAGMKIVHLPFFTNSVGDFAALVSAYNRSIKRVAGEEAVPVIDMAEYFDSLPGKEEYFTDSMHMTNEGDRLLAERIAAELGARHMLAQ